MKRVRYYVGWYYIIHSVATASCASLSSSSSSPSVVSTKVIVTPSSPAMLRLMASMASELSRFARAGRLTTGKVLTARVSKLGEFCISFKKGIFSAHCVDVIVFKGWLVLTYQWGSRASHTSESPWFVDGAETSRHASLRPQQQHHRRQHCYRR